MNVVDSSGWLEYFADGPNAELFAEPLADPGALIVPTVSIYEVFRKVLVERGESEALEAVALMQQGQVVELDTTAALAAAKTSVDLRLPMADAMIYTTARIHGATLWSQDEDFEEIDGVRYIPKSS